MLFSPFGRPALPDGAPLVIETGQPLPHVTYPPGDPATAPGDPRTASGAPATAPGGSATVPGRPTAG
ncbi:hypothetical protein [Streptomyces chartreusis]|uniref:hypothetical protein n=1 Tax=Streptomyces chartreusis TaxID=1969 RepID=UPI0002E424C5|nr:hypothetical protein [Streptomyces chartreusis]